MNDQLSAPSIFRTRQLEEDDGPELNPTNNPTMGEIISARFSRRGFLRGSMAATAISATASPMAILAATGKAHAQDASGGSAFNFPELKAGVDADHHVADGYDADVLMRWGDKVFADAPEFDPNNQTKDAQERQFGYNNDYVGFIPLDGDDDRGLLAVNHEYTAGHLMFPGIVSIKDGEIELAAATKDQVDVEMVAHGGTIIEIQKVDGKWQPVLDGKLNRPITANTPMHITGPAAGDPRLQTSADPSGTEAIGTFNNCSGGVTPWGTYIMSEENFHGFFTGKLPKGHPEVINYQRLALPQGTYNWGAYHDRFDISKEPQEPNRFGWVVEVDVMDPESTPQKRTALGRFRHEGAANAVAKSGQVVFYMGDDQALEYVYKFVTAGKYNPDDRAANLDLMNEGTLYAARFNDSGEVEWLPLVHGKGPLIAENGFSSQADVLIEPRHAADSLQATPMDRPEDIEPAPATGRAYVMLSNICNRP